MVLKEGQIVEQGTHKELVELNGTYRELYDTQFKKSWIQEKKNLAKYTNSRNWTMNFHKNEFAVS